jgi:hypothetical protein
MAEAAQSYSNHVRRHPLYLFFLFPALTVNLGWSLWLVARQPDLNHAVQLLLAAALIVMMLIMRTYSLKVQDRVIRLEERLRYQRVLPADLAAKTFDLPLRLIVALRFASDEELPELVRQALAGKFAKPDDAKRAIKNWRADHLRV